MQAIVLHPVESEIDGEAGFKSRPALAFPKTNGSRRSRTEAVTLRTGSAHIIPVWRPNFIADLDQCPNTRRTIFLSADGLPFPNLGLFMPRIS